MNEEREILCAKCACSPVCTFTAAYQKIQREIDNFTISGLPNENGETPIIKLSNIPWIETPIVLECKHFVRKPYR